MALTIKKLIEELQKIENKFLEVEIWTVGERKVIHEIDRIYLHNKKLVIRVKQE